jgi:hypothetical protein
VATMMTPEMINSAFILIQLRFVQGPIGLPNSGLATETVEGWILSAHVLRGSGRTSIKCTMSAKPQWLGNSLNQGSCEYFRNIPSRNAAASTALPRWRRLADVCTYEIQSADKALKRLRRQILTIVGAMSTRGMIAAMTIEAATDGGIFLAFLDEVLCPVLQSGDVVVMDNLSPTISTESARASRPVRQSCTTCFPILPT